MAIIALTGGSTGVARYILDELLNQKKHKVVLLSRGEQPELSQKGVDVKQVDYTSVESLKNALQGVDTLISGQTFSNEFVQTHKNLLQACEAVGVKRFIPSEFAHDLQSFPDLFGLYQFKVDTRELLKNYKIEYTLVCCGLYMDYLLPKGGKKYFKDVGIPVDVSNATAVIPGTGDEPVTLTFGEDIGKAVCVLLDEPKWEKYTYINGDTTSWNKILQAGEQATGKKFNVTYKKTDDLRKLYEDATEVMKKFYAEVDLAYADGKMEVKGTRNYDGVKFTSAKELIQQTYGGK